MSYFFMYPVAMPNRVGARCTFVKPGPICGVGRSADRDFTAKSCVIIHGRVSQKMQSASMPKIDVGLRKVNLKSEGHYGVGG